jgi:hypothetical protein
VCNTRCTAVLTGVILQFTINMAWVSLLKNMSHLVHFNSSNICKCFVDIVFSNNYLYFVKIDIWN